MQAAAPSDGRREHLLSRRVLLASISMEKNMGKMMPAVALAVYALMAGGLGLAAKADEVSTTRTTTTTSTAPAFGYDDGYWDQGHAWHTWATPDAAVTFRREHHDHYYDWHHDRDADKGWREHDTYWNH
jgi:hypothetical protein